MHKFFLKHNILSEKEEINGVNNIFCQTLNNNSTAMQKLKNTIQSLYNYLVLAKEKDDSQIDDLCKIELLTSNLYYSFFASPLELPEKNSNTLIFRDLIINALEEAKNLIEIINIPEQNRIASIIYINLQNILNKINKTSSSIN